MKAKMSRMTASYFGVKVEVIWQMAQCSLVGFRGRKFIVDTADLCAGARFQSRS